MALRGASSTTTDPDWLDFAELAKEGPAVLFSVLEVEDETNFGNGPVRPVRVRVVILTGSKAGEVYPDERVLAKGIRDKLTTVGDDVCGRLELYSRGTRKHPGLNPEREGDLELAEAALAKLNGNGSVPAQRAKAKATDELEDAPF